MMTNKTLFIDAIKTFGRTHQLYKVAEELNELGTEVYKEINGRGEKKKIIDEIADVYIVLAELELMCELENSDIGCTIDYKLNRLRLKIEGEKNGTNKKD